MPLIDPNNNTAGLDKRLQSETDPVRRRMLEEVRFHVVAETARDLDALLARLSPHNEYVLHYGSAPAIKISGLDAIRRDLYDPYFASLYGTFQLDISNVLVDDHTVIFEG